MRSARRRAVRAAIGSPCGATAATPTGTRLTAPTAARAIAEQRDEGPYSDFSSAVPPTSQGIRLACCDRVSAAHILASRSVGPEGPFGQEGGFPSRVDSKGVDGCLTESSTHLGCMGMYLFVFRIDCPLPSTRAKTLRICKSGPRRLARCQ
jgi:hypothetical protein